MIATILELIRGIDRAAVIHDMKTASTLSVKIPLSELLQVHRVIERLNSQR
jgi:hypothetical protein